MTTLEEIGAEHWDDRRCANSACGEKIHGHEFVLQISTGHVRWFCSVYCVVDGLKNHNERIWNSSLTDYEEGGP